MTVGGSTRGKLSTASRHSRPGKRRRAKSQPARVPVTATAAVAGRDGLEAGQSLQITWEVDLRGADVPHATLRGYLDRFHACVVGELAAGSAFTGQLSYVELSRRA